ncbi:hypothetical protein CHS0354_023216 [Potamilus streckersoni]|uniref:Uncharacterized protein n=1 Tax=Potamilus streckersoni TaxID=2493646 RepID=A0AAE0SJS5_9BIVA|nr:hypothetical protein CHS0354_023216 [Potamilus streckersoni]
MEEEKIERLRVRILQCPICMDEYKDPRILTCHHSVCMGCLEDFIRSSSSTGRVFRCPSCRAEVCVPRGGVKDFPPNFYINCIQDEIGAKPYFGICDICNKDWLVSQYRCVECDLDICRFCVHEHRLFKEHTSRKPNIIRIETGNTSLPLASKRTCEHHPDETLQLYCCTCSIPVCITCVCDFHKKHETLPLVKKLNSAAKQLQSEHDQIQADLIQVNKTLSDLDNLEATMNTNSDEVITEIRHQARSIILAIDKMAEARVQQVVEYKNKINPDVHAYKKELKHFSDILQKGGTFLEDIQEGDVSLELVDAFQKYKTGVDVTRKSVCNKEIYQKYFSFRPGKSVERFGFYGVHFGYCHTDHSSAVFLADSSKRRKVRDICKLVLEKITLGRLVSLLMVCFVLIGIFKLAWTFVNNDFEQFPLETFVGLIFIIYILTAAIFAYRKSSIKVVEIRK